MAHMIISDLDGTLLNTEQQVSETDYQTLIDLGQKGHVRVVATGRSPYSFSKVIPTDFPIDYLVFSSGAGIMNWKTGEVTDSHVLSGEKVHELVNVLVEQGVSFKVLQPAPDNHHFLFYRNGVHHPDFEKRMEYYRGFEKELSFDPPNFGEASQLLIILENDVDEFKRLSDLCTGVKVVRATSPIDHQSIWMEVFHPQVSKGNACAVLCHRLGIPLEETLAVGNDYNDIDLLRFAHESFVVRNAPEAIRQLGIVVPSNNHSGFSEAVRRSAKVLP